MNNPMEVTPITSLICGKAPALQYQWKPYAELRFYRSLWYTEEYPASHHVFVIATEGFTNAGEMSRATTSQGGVRSSAKHTNARNKRRAVISKGTRPS